MVGWESWRHGWKRIDQWTTTLVSFPPGISPAGWDFGFFPGALCSGRAGESGAGGPTLPARAQASGAGWWVVWVGAGGFGWRGRLGGGEGRFRWLGGWLLQVV